MNQLCNCILTKCEDTHDLNALCIREGSHGCRFKTFCLHFKNIFMQKNVESLPWPPAYRAAWLNPGVPQRLRSSMGSSHFQTQHQHWRQTPTEVRRSHGDRGDTEHKALGHCSGLLFGSSRLPLPASGDGSPDHKDGKCEEKSKRMVRAHVTQSSSFIPQIRTFPYYELDFNSSLS